MTPRDAYLAMEAASSDERFLVDVLADAPLTEWQRTVLHVYLGRVAQKRELAVRAGRS